MSFNLDATALDAINIPQAHEENAKALKKLGGQKALLAGLKTSVGGGLAKRAGKLSCPDDKAARIEAFGENVLPSPDPKSWLELFIEAFDDTTVLILCASAVVSLAVGIYDDRRKTAAGQEPEGAGGWVEGVAIIVAVLIVAVVTATNDFTKEQQFRALSAINDDVLVKVVRGGEVREVSTTLLLVGDVVQLEAGDKVPADGVLLRSSDIKVSEATLTGESEEKDKSHHGDGDPFMLSGTEVTGGGGTMVVFAVGERSQWGSIRAKMEKEEVNTPLQDKLDTLAEQIGYVGMGAAVLTFVALMASWYLDESNGGQGMLDEMLKAFIIGVTIVVVAVPEGLPLAVTISLAYSTMKMLADNNLIRVLAACETMGNATTICSDKTGTLTMNRMTVVQACFAGQVADKGPTEGLNGLGASAREVLVQGLSLNTTASLSVADVHPDGTAKVIGNKTEGAMLLLLKACGEEPSELRASLTDDATVLFPFSSTKKRMSVVVKKGAGSGRRCLTKGAAEAIVERCSSQLTPSGDVKAMTAPERKKMLGLVSAWASQSFRVIALAHKDVSGSGELPSEEELNSELCLDGLIAIQDPLRPEVPLAVKTCQAAGIMVRMVTGDNLETAVAIAKECGILSEGGVALEGSEFRHMTPKQLDAVLPKLQVLARSSPEDKYLLVTRLNGGGGGALPSTQTEWEALHPTKSWELHRDLLLPGYKEEWEAARHGGIGEVVGVTGDGTNDGPALRVAEVGLAMGICGTDVAKEASDIIIMDDNFSSIVKAVVWGRCVFDNIRKFLQFQLTVNIVALVTTFLSAGMGYEPPLNAVMMLWVNLIMDTMGALALGTELPTSKLLERAPYKRNASLISRVMWRNVLVQATFQLVASLVLLQHGSLLFPGVEQSSRAHFTIIFNFFVFAQVFNELNARQIGDDWNVLKGLGSNTMFLAVVAFTVLAQVFIVESGGDFTKTVGLSAEQWLRTVGLATVTLPLGVLMRLVPVAEDPHDFAPVSCASIKKAAPLELSKSPEKEASTAARRETRSTKKTK